LPALLLLLQLANSSFYRDRHLKLAQIHSSFQLTIMKAIVSKPTKEDATILAPLFNPSPLRRSFRCGLCGRYSTQNGVMACLKGNNPTSSFRVNRPGSPPPLLSSPLLQPPFVLNNAKEPFPH